MLCWRVEGAGVHVVPQAVPPSQVSPLGQEWCMGCSPFCRAAPTPRGRCWRRWWDVHGGPSMSLGSSTVPSARPGAHGGPCHSTSSAARTERPRCCHAQQVPPCSVHWGVRPSCCHLLLSSRSSALFQNPLSQAHVTAPSKSSSIALLVPQKPSLRTQGREPG